MHVHSDSGVDWLRYIVGQQAWTSAVLEAFQHCFALCCAMDYRICEPQILYSSMMDAALDMSEAYLKYFSEASPQLSQPA